MGARNESDRESDWVSCRLPRELSSRKNDEVEFSAAVKGVVDPEEVRKGRKSSIG